MSRRNIPLMVIAALSAITASWLLLERAGLLLEARAEEPDTYTEGSGGAATPASMRCKSFEIEAGATLDLPGGDTEVGRWVGQQSGWGLWTVDYEAVQKANGYPQHLVQVCLSS